MANFFKDYHKGLKEKRGAAEQAKATRINYEAGQLVYINPQYDENGTGKKYFVEYLEKDMVLLANTKKEALSGYGYIYSVHDIVCKKERS